MFIFFSFLLGYVFGSIPFGLLFTYMAGLDDIRRFGSGNIGATNVLRTGKKSIAFLTLLGDSFKGIFAILILRSCLEGALSTYVEDIFGPIRLEAWSSDALFFVCGLGALLGHMFPFGLGFRGGGKGVATFFGLVAILCSWRVFAAVGATWLLVAFFSRYSSLSSLVATALAPLWSVFLNSSQDYGLISKPVFLFLCGLFIWWRHRSNIERLYWGTETKIGEKNSAPDM